MEDPLVIIKPFLSLLAVGVLILCGWKILNWAWLTPKKLEKCLRQQGFNGNSYRLLFGEIKEIFTMTRQARSKPMSLTDDIAPYVIPHYHQTVKNYGLYFDLVNSYDFWVFLLLLLMCVICGKVQARIQLGGLVLVQE